MRGTCPYPGCTQSIPRYMFACRGHWYMLPIDVRNAIWRAYRSDDVFALADAHEVAHRYYAGKVTA